jgi:hypothetical protein
MLYPTLPFARGACATAMLVALAGASFAQSPFRELANDEALIKAAEEDKVLLVVWTREGEPTSDRFLEQFEDETLRAWLRSNVVALHCEAEKHAQEAEKAGITSYPSAVFVSPTDGVPRMLNGFLDAGQFLLESQAVLSRLVGAERPEGDAAEDPYAWLAYGNAIYPDVTRVHDALDAYLWCLDNGEQHIPGFRSRHLEFLVKRIAHRKLNSQRAKTALVERRDVLRNALIDGSGDAETVREVMLFNFWLRQVKANVSLFDRLRMGGEKQRELAKLLFDDIVATLLAAKRYDVVIQYGGDIPARTTKRIEDFKADNPASDTRADILGAAASYYEALLGYGRGADAQELLDLTLAAFPGGRSYGIFVGVLVQLKLYDQARTLATAGKATVGDLGQKQIAIALRRIPAEAGGADGTEVLPERVRLLREQQAREKAEAKQERAGGGGH